MQTEEGQTKYKELKHCIQKLYREAKDNYFKVKCEEIEKLDTAHSKLLHKKINELQPQGSRIKPIIKDKQGTEIMDKEGVLKRWAEYVEELYEDRSKEEADMGDLVNEKYTISSYEISIIINKLPKKKACGIDGISAELLQGIGEKGLELITKLINMIYKSRHIHT